jgi:hypothetical protein
MKQFLAPWRRMSICSVGLCTALLAWAAESEAATLLGHSVNVSYEQAGFPILQTTVLVGPGTELADFGLIPFDIDLGASRITLTAKDDFGAAPGSSFGFSFTEAPGTPAFFVEGFETEGSGTPFDGFSAASIMPLGDGFFVELGDVSATSGDILRLLLGFEDSTSVIPLPASMPLVLVGVGALFAAGRRRSA